MTGASGKGGRVGCAHALARGRRGRGRTRDRGRAGALAAAGVEVVQGALGDADVAEKMAGADAAYVMVPIGPTTVEIGRATHDAIEAAGIGRAVRLSVVSPFADSDTFLGRWHTELDADFAGRSFTSAIVRPHAFMENLLGSAHSVRDGKLVGANADGRTPYIAASDVAACVVELAASESSCSGTHDLSGPATHDGKDVAGMLSALLGRDVVWVNVDPDAYEQMLRGAGLPDLFVELVADLARLARGDVGAEPTDGFQKLMGRAPEGLASWLERHRGAFGGG